MMHSLPIMDALMLLQSTLSSKDVLHKSQWYGHSPLWTRWCFFIYCLV